MPKYNEMLAKAMEKDKVQDITHDIHTWSEEGQKLVGRVMDIVPFDKGKFETDVKQYIMDTDDGLVSTVLGSSTDKQLAHITIKGAVIAIEFRGKFQLEDGRQCNKFKVTLIENA